MLAVDDVHCNNQLGRPHITSIASVQRSYERFCSRLFLYGYAVIENSMLKGKRPVLPVANPVQGLGVNLARSAPKMMQDPSHFTDIKTGGNVILN